MLEVPMTAFASPLDKARPLQVSRQRSQFAGHENSTILILECQAPSPGVYSESGSPMGLVSASGSAAGSQFEERPSQSRHNKVEILVL